MKQTGTATAKNSEPDWESPVGLATILAETFPSLRAAMGGRTFDPEWMERFAAETTDVGTREAARFVLDVWESHEPTRTVRFDLAAAMLALDWDHREAFATWAYTPSYPRGSGKTRFEKRPRLWSANEAIKMLWEYLELFPLDVVAEAEERLADLDSALERVEKLVAETPHDA